MVRIGSVNRLDVARRLVPRKDRALKGLEKHFLASLDSPARDLKKKSSKIGNKGEINRSDVKHRFCILN